jgi:sarcosine oxidase
MTPQADVVVIGLGAAGAFAAHDLAARGARVIGIEPGELVHDRGASAGESRLFRAAYHEGTEYLPLLLESRRRWLTTEQAGQRSLFVDSGVLSIGAPDAPQLRGVLESLDVADLPHEVLTTDELRRRHPQHTGLTDEIGVLDRWGGVLRPEAAVAEIQRQATAAGAELRPHHAAREIIDHGTELEIRTLGGTLRTAQVIVTAGVHTAGLLPEFPEIADALRIVPLALTWFAPEDPSRFRPEVFPAFIRDREEQHVFGVPTLDGSLVKCGWAATYDPIPTPEALPGRLTDAQLTEIGTSVHAFLAELPTGISRHSLHADVYTPDRRPLLGRLGPRMTVATGFSGHGFKMSPALGAAAAAVALDEDPGHDLTAFDPGRFS